MVSMGEGPLPYSELTGFSLVFLESSQEFSLMVSMGEGPLPYSELTRFLLVS